MPNPVINRRIVLNNRQTGIPSWVMMGSMIVHNDSDEYYYMQSNFDLTPITGANKWVFIFSQTKSTDTATKKTIFSFFKAVNNERGFDLRFETNGKLRALWSNDGITVNNQIETTNAVPDTWKIGYIVFDPTLSGITNVLNIYLDNIQVATTSIADGGAGNYNIFKPLTTKLTFGCFFSATNVPSDLYIGFINQFAFHSIGVVSEFTNIYNGGSYKRSDIVSPSTCLINMDIDNAIYDSGTLKYTVPDNIGSQDFTMTAVGSLSLRPDNWIQYLNPNGYGFPMTKDDFSTSNNWHVYQNAVGGATWTFNYPGLNLNCTHTATPDPSRDAVVVMSKGAYDLNDGELWVGVDYDWDTDVLDYCHGVFLIQDARNEDTFTVFSQRDLSTASGTFKVLDSVLNTQNQIQTTIPKGSRVYLKFDGTTASFWWNNSGVLTQVWTNRTVDVGRHVLIRFYTRDSSAYSSPDNITFQNLKIYRNTPTDL